MKRRAILLGPPGSGKGTVAGRLQQRLGLPHLSSGQILRREVEAQSEVGRKVKGHLEQGNLVPDDLVVAVMEQAVQRLWQTGFLLDGFPRTLKQAETLDLWMAERNTAIDAVILYECPEPLIFQRITGRRECPSCGRVYHLRWIPPAEAGVCDFCKTALVQREDDTEPVLRRRLDIYKVQTEPLVRHYEDQGRLFVVDASEVADEMVAATVRILSE